MKPLLFRLNKYINNLCFGCSNTQNKSPKFPQKTLLDALRHHPDKKIISEHKEDLHDAFIKSKISPVPLVSLVTIMQ